MKSHHLLSNEQYSLLTSQKEVSNPSEQRRRITNTIEQAFKTFDVILTSDFVPSKFVEELFNHERVKYFLDNLVRYETENMLAEEANKQKIASDMIRLGCYYFQARYKETSFLTKQIDQIKELLLGLDYLAQSQQDENDAMELYRARSRLKKPPQIIPQKDFWTAECMYCFNYSSGSNKTEEKAIKNIHHSKGCMFLKDVKKFDGRHKQDVTWQYIRTIHPRD